MKKFKINLENHDEVVELLKGVFKLTNTEVIQVIALVKLLGPDGIITKEIKDQWGEVVNLPVQSVRNKLTTLRKKNVLMGNSINPLLKNQPIEIIIVHEPTEINSEESS